VRSDVFTSLWGNVENATVEESAGDDAKEHDPGQNTLAGGQQVCQTDIGLVAFQQRSAMALAAALHSMSSGLTAELLLLVGDCSTATTYGLQPPTPFDLTHAESDCVLADGIRLYRSDTNSHTTQCLGTLVANHLPACTPHERRTHVLAFRTSGQGWGGSSWVAIVIRMSSSYAWPAVHVSDHTFEGALTLPDALAEQYLLDCYSAFRTVVPNTVTAGLQLPSPHEICLRGAHRLVDNAGLAFGAGINTQLFNAVDVIASLPYEGTDPKAAIAFVRPDTSSESLRRLCSCPIAAQVGIEDAKRVRKLLQAASPDHPLVIQGGFVRGFFRNPSSDASKSHTMYMAAMSGKGWILRSRERNIMQIRDGRPRLPIIRLSQQHVGNLLNQWINQQARAQFRDTLERLGQLGHGGMLVISREAEAETARLAASATPLSRREFLTGDLVDQLTAVDGAVMVDPHGICHAFGVILDGNAQPDEDPARGARHNSARRYVMTRAVQADNPCCAIVVSEDGPVTVVMPPN
jgi:hypothetical protein